MARPKPNRIAAALSSGSRAASLRSSVAKVDNNFDFNDLNNDNINNINNIIKNNNNNNNNNNDNNINNNNNNNISNNNVDGQKKDKSTSSIEQQLATSSKEQQPASKKRTVEQRSPGKTIQPWLTTSVSSAEQRKRWEHQVEIGVKAFQEALLLATDEKSTAATKELLAQATAIQAGRQLCSYVANQQLA